MGKRVNWVTYVLGFLIVLGIIYQFSTNPTSIIIPIVVFGLIYILWKFPPNTWKRRSSHTWFHPKPKSRAARKASFRVIHGNKKGVDKKDDEDPPVYH